MVGEEVLFSRLKIMVDGVCLGGETRGYKVEDLAERVRVEEGSIPGLSEFSDWLPICYEWDVMGSEGRLVECIRVWVVWVRNIKGNRAYLRRNCRESKRALCVMASGFSATASTMGSRTGRIALLVKDSGSFSQSRSPLSASGVGIPAGSLM